MSLPTTMKAVVIGSRSMIWPVKAAMGGYANEAEFVTRPVPSPTGNELLVKVECFASNPTDVIHLDMLGGAGSIIGCDFAGTVVAAGPDVKIHQVGDKIFGAVHGGKYPEKGSAAEYCIAEDDLVLDVPEGMKMEEAVTFGVGFLTAAATLYDSQSIPLPPARVSGSPWYFVSGGATAVGMFVIQLAKLAGFKVIASCSEKSFELVKSYGADEVVSYADHTAALAKISDITSGGVTHGIDCVGGKPNIKFAINAFGPKGGKLTSIMPGGKSHRKEVELEDLLLYRYMGKAFSFIPVIMAFPAEPEKRAFLAKFAAQATKLVETNGIKPNPIEVSKGMESLPASWVKLRNKEVSGKKLVCDFRV